MNEYIGQRTAHYESGTVRIFFMYKVDSATMNICYQIVRIMLLEL